MISFLLCFLVNSTIYPQNALWDHYTVIPPLGTVKSIASSNLHVYAISGDYLLFINKQNFTFEKSVYFSCEPYLVGYDQYTNDIWVVCRDTLVRFTTTTYSLRKFPFTHLVHRFAIDASNLYVETMASGGKYRINKATGAISSVNVFPENLFWYKTTTDSDIRKYPFLSPYYYFDDPDRSQRPTQQYPITAIHEDGMYLYVGTDRYGILRYHTISWQSQRIVHGPLDGFLKRVRRDGEKIYFLSTSGISYRERDTENWRYLRLDGRTTDFAFFNSELFVAAYDQVVRTSGALEFPYVDVRTDILSIETDANSMYIGTRSGSYRIFKGSKDVLHFGPDHYVIYSIYPTDDAVYVGGEFAMYKFDKETAAWSTLLNFGIKKIVGISAGVYALGLNNQIIQYRPGGFDTLDIDTSWTLLPYFNIYDIDAGDDVVYCATHTGIYYYDPANIEYKVIYNLPRIRYDYIFLVDDHIFAIAGGTIYSLPVEHRD
jgi:hypothetical protein